MSKYQVTLFDPNNKLHLYGIEAEDSTEAVTIAMDTAFEEMPTNRFALAGVEALPETLPNDLSTRSSEGTDVPSE